MWGVKDDFFAYNTFYQAIFMRLSDHEDRWVHNMLAWWNEYVVYWIDTEGTERSCRRVFGNEQGQSNHQRSGRRTLLPIFQQIVAISCDNLLKLERQAGRKATSQSYYVPDLQILPRDFRFAHQRSFPHQLLFLPFLINWFHVFLEF
jgi:hypothetical protein